MGTTAQSSPIGEKLLVRPIEACKRLNMGRTRLYQEMATGRLRSIRVGGLRLIPVAELESYIARTMAEQNGGDAA